MHSGEDDIETASQVSVFSSDSICSQAQSNPQKIAGYQDLESARPVDEVCPVVLSDEPDQTFSEERFSKATDKPGSQRTCRPKYSRRKITSPAMPRIDEQAKSMSTQEYYKKMLRIEKRKAKYQKRLCLATERYYDEKLSLMRERSRDDKGQPQIWSASPTFTTNQSWYGSSGTNITTQSRSAASSTILTTQISTDPDCRSRPVQVYDTLQTANQSLYEYSMY